MAADAGLVPTDAEIISIGGTWRGADSAIVLKTAHMNNLIYVSLCFIGAIVSLELVFYIGDIANALMAIPNLIGLGLLSGVVAKTTKSFFKKYKKLEDFDKDPNPSF